VAALRRPVSGELQMFAGNPKKLSGIRRLGNLSENLETVEQKI
jgi:hypothetical protein